MSFIRNLANLRHKSPAQAPEWLIIGLGNPGGQYARTRHNVGFMCVNRIAQRSGARFKSSGKDRADVSITIVASQSVVLAEPQTYMNDSGNAVVRLLKHFGLNPTQCVVISDDVDLPFGTVRIRAAGSAGGQRGLQSIINTVGTNEFPRIRVGIGRGAAPTKDYVLTEFDSEQRRQLNTLCDHVAQIVEAIVSDGVTFAMNTYNGVAAAATSTVAGERTQP